MQKIPTLFRRDPDDMRRVTRDVHPDCQWVLDGEGVPTRKYDGTCVLLAEGSDGTAWYARREVKPGKNPPPGFWEVEHDAITGKTVGWEPIEQSAFAKFHAEAIANGPLCEDGDDECTPGTYELIGPKVNGNPEGAAGHYLVMHVEADVLNGVPRDFDGLAKWLAGFEGEGIVWHHPDGRMAKLKKRDFLDAVPGRSPGTRV